MATALASERLLEVHFRYVMELIEHTSGEIEPDRALAMYGRLHHLRGQDAQAIYHQVFVTLGRRTLLKPDVKAAGSLTEKEWETPQSVFGTIRTRLRGRVNDELREWVEFHTGRAETELLWAHVENAMQFVELLKPDVSLADAVSTYAQELGVSAPRTETIYYLVLAHSSTVVPSDEAELRGRDDASRIFAEPLPRSLRLVAPRRTSGGRPRRE